MPNSLNYGAPLVTTLFQRPSRITPTDAKLLRLGETPVIFGTTQNDYVELWIYNSDGSIASHLNILATDAAVQQATFVDQTGAFETVNIDLRRVAEAGAVQPGRYVMVANFFRNEIGSETGNKLYIADISDDRTELRLVADQVDNSIVNDIFEFVVPSVPRQFAKGLLDQAFGTIPNTTDAHKITSVKVETELKNTVSDTMNRIAHAGALQEYLNLYGIVVSRAHKRTLDIMADDVRNYNVQQLELGAYVQKAIQDVIYDLKQKNEFDARFNLTN